MVATLNHLLLFATVRLKLNTDALGALLAEQMLEKEPKQPLDIVRALAQSVLEIGGRQARGAHGLSPIIAVQSRFVLPALLNAVTDRLALNRLLIIEKTATKMLSIGLTHMA